MAVALCLTSGLPWIVRGAVAFPVLVCAARVLRRYVFLRGEQSLRGVEWSATPSRYSLLMGPSLRRVPATPDCCRRYGPGLWLLRFQSEEGLVTAMIDTRCQNAADIRRLARQLFAGEDAPAGRPGREIAGS